jgi:hypothetical protein
MPHPRAAGPPPWSRSEEVDTRTRSLETVARRERANPLKSLLAQGVGKVAVSGR